MIFEIVSEISNVETIAEGSSIRVRQHLIKRYGKGRWKKKKGIATVKLRDGGVSAWQRFTGTKHMGSANETSRSSFRYLIRL